jgi:GT2 family glycosyltransferase
MTAPATGEPAATLLLMTYNQAPFLAAAIASALAQEGPPLEILISDNGSTDGTAAVIAEALRGYAGPHRVRCHRFAQNLGGPAEHVNAALPLTEGRLVILQAGDDVSLPGRALALCRAFAAEPSPLLLYSDVEVIDEHGAPLYRATQAAPPSGADPRLWFARVQAFALGACMALDRRLAGLFPPLPSGVFEDQVLPFRAALAGRVRHLPEVLVRYRRHGRSASQTPGARASRRAAAAAARAMLARQHRIAAARRADLAHWQAAGHLAAAEARDLEASIAGSLALAEESAALTVGRLPRRLRAAWRLRRHWRARQFALALVQALLPGLVLALQRRRRGA